MKLTFENFKREIPSQILERGRAYVRDGNVNDLDITVENHWSAQVSGSDIYDVEIEQLDDGTLTCNCTCPYEHGLYCKHVAAVLYAIEETVSTQAKKRKTDAKNTNKKATLRALLDKASSQELVSALLELASQDKRIASQLMIRFGGANQDKSVYNNLIKDTLRAHMDHGFLDYQGARRAGAAVSKLVAQATHLLEQGQWEAAVTSYRTLIENVAATIHQADDSDGQLGAVVAQSIEGLALAATQGIEAQESELFSYCLIDAQAKTMTGWEWRWDLLRIAADLVSSREQRQQLFAVLDQFQVQEPPRNSKANRWDATDIISNNFISRFDAENAALIKLSVIERLESDAAIEKFIEEHIHLDQFKTMTIERMLKRGELKQAKQRIQEGIAINQQQRLPGLVVKYKQMQLNLATLEKDTPTVIQLARELLLNGRDPQYYDLLKKTIPASEWEDFIEKLIKEAQSNRYLSDFVLWLYARENRWQAILKVVQLHRWSENAERYRKELEAHFPNEVATFYERTVYDMLEPVTDRGTYRMAYKLLTRMKSLNHASRVTEIVTELKLMYPKRRSLLDELANV